jgi:hypothetical protein
MDSTLYIMFKHLHAIMRWLLLGFLLVTLFISLIQLMGRKGLSPSGILTARYSLISAHIQLLTGFVLYIISPKVVFSASSMQSPILRFFLVEHVLIMLLAVTLLTVGYIKLKKRISSGISSRLVFWYYLSALILILAGIPWPFLSYGGALL